MKKCRKKWQQSHKKVAIKVVKNITKKLAKKVAKKVAKINKDDSDKIPLIRSPVLSKEFQLCRTTCNHDGVLLLLITIRLGFQKN